MKQITDKSQELKFDKTQPSTIHLAFASYECYQSCNGRAPMLSIEHQNRSLKTEFQLSKLAVCVIASY